MEGVIQVHLDSGKQIVVTATYEEFEKLIGSEQRCKDVYGADLIIVSSKVEAIEFTPETGAG